MHLKWLDGLKIGQPLNDQTIQPGREGYRDYLKSDEWRATRERFIEKRKASGKPICCYCCGHDGALQLHHKTYRRLGHEDMKDLELLCARCHEHCEWALKAQKKTDLTRWNIHFALRRAMKKYDKELAYKIDLRKV